MFVQYDGIKHAGLRPSSMKPRERSASPRLSGKGNQAGGTSSIQYEGVQTESMSSSVRYKESSRRDFVCLLRSRTIGWLVLVCLVRGIKQAGLHLSSTKSRDRMACFSPSGMRNQAGWTSFVWYKVVRKESLTSKVWYEESSTQDFVHSVQNHAKGDLDLDNPVRGIKHAGLLHSSSTKSRKRRACPRPFGMRNQVGGTSSVRYEDTRMENLSSSV